MTLLYNYTGVNSNNYMNKAKPPRSGIMQHLIVHDQKTGAIIGKGWITLRDDGRMSKPELYDIMGNPMQQGWYTIEATDIKQFVIIPRMIQ